MNTSATTKPANGYGRGRDWSDIMMLMNDREPRPPLRFPPVPTPFNMEKPQLTVPDVSLIFDSSSDSINTSGRTLAEQNSHMPVNSSSPLYTPPARTAAAPAQFQTNGLNGPSPPGPAQASAPSSGNSEAAITFKLIKHLLDMTKAQGKLIKKMDGEIQTLKQNEEKHFAELMSAIKNVNIAACKEAKIASSTQTETVALAAHVLYPAKTANANTNVETTSGGSAEVNENNESGNRADCLAGNKAKAGSSTAGSARNRIFRKTKKTNSNSPRKANGASLKDTQVSRASTNGNGTSECAEDLSTFLRDLELPPIEEQSAFSSTEDSLHSLGPIDLQDYNNGSENIGPSISEYETSSSSEEGDGDGDGNANGAQIVQPTVTFYRNVLGCVNRILDGDSSNANVQPGPTNVQMQNPRATGDVVVTSQQTNINISANFTRSITDTTLYGFPSNNLSFATKQYLQRHGLVHGTSPRPNKSVGVGSRVGGGRGHQNNNNGNGNMFQHKPFLQDGSSDSNYPERILDVTALKNQPKLF